MKKAIGFAVVVISLFLLTGKVFAYHFFDGSDWSNMSSYKLAPQDESTIKTMFLKSMFEITLFDGKPTLSIDPNRSDFLAVYDSYFRSYIEIMDKFYSNPENLKLPLFFALKIADMSKMGLDSSQMEKYRLAIISKLKEDKLLD